MPIRAAFAAALLGVLAACGQQTPQEAEADRIRDAADAQADALEAEAQNQAAALEARAADMINASATSGSYDAQMASVRADALREEASLIEEQAEARARAVRDRGQAEASALLAQ